CVRKCRHGKFRPRKAKSLIPPIFPQVCPVATDKNDKFRAISRPGNIPGLTLVGVNIKKYDPVFQGEWT
ncbi:MAG: hypothetical protein LBU64_13760, partial [Planctomycetota bacterium]|nr:hypothetical protein [Planctomycetota bacterium]